MTSEDERYLRDIEAAAAALRAFPDDYRILRDLLNSLPPGTAPSLRAAATALLEDSAGAGGVDTTGLTLQSGQPLGTQPGGSLGILPQLFYNKSNMLLDPGFEAVAVINPIGLAYAALSGVTHWYARYILNSGTAPTDRRWIGDYTREDDTLAVNSDAPSIFLDGFAAGSTDILVASGTFASRGGAPFLVGAYRLVDKNAQNLTNLTSVTAWCEIHDVTGNILAASTPIDWLAFKAGSDESVQLSVAYSGATSGRLVIRLRVVATGAGATIQVNVGEPQLTRSAVQAPPPFSPIIAGWLPPELYARRSSVAKDLITARIVGELAARFLVQVAGDMAWGPGSATQDARLQRTGTKELSVDDAAGGPVRMLHVGPHFVQGPTAMDLAITYGADGPTNVARSDEGVPVSSSVISYAAGKVASVVTTRFGKTITVVPTFTGDNITAVDRDVA